MRSIALLFICSLNLVYSLNAQENYYWADGEKFYLGKEVNTSYVLYNSIVESTIPALLGIIDGQSTEAELTTYTASILQDTGFAERQISTSWRIVERKLDESVLAIDDIQYIGPSFMVDGKELILSEFFYVKLKKSEDVSVLRSESERYKRIDRWTKQVHATLVRRILR